MVAETDVAPPAELVAGDVWRWWPAGLGGFPAADGWALEYVFSGPGPAVTVAGVEVGGAWRVEVAGAASAAWLPGRYRWTVRVVADNGDRLTLASGRVEVVPDPATLADADPATWWERVKAACEAAVLGKASADQQEMTIAGRTLKRIPLPELVALHREAERRVAELRARERAGGRRPSRVLTTFGG